MNDQSRLSGFTFKGCLQIFAALCVIGYIAEQSSCNWFDQSCSICGEYIYEHFERESAFSDSDISNTLGKARVKEYKEKIASESSATYVLNLSNPEDIENNQIRGIMYLSLHDRLKGDIAYKGKFLTTPNETMDGLLRVEQRYNDLNKDWEQITYSKNSNVLSFKISDGDLVVKSLTSDAYGLSSLNEAVFKK